MSVFNCTKSLVSHINLKHALVFLDTLLFLHRDIAAIDFGHFRFQTSSCSILRWSLLHHRSHQIHQERALSFLHYQVRIDTSIITLITFFHIFIVNFYGCCFALFGCWIKVLAIGGLWSTQEVICFYIWASCNWTYTWNTLSIQSLFKPRCHWVLIGAWSFDEFGSLLVRAVS